MHDWLQPWASPTESTTLDIPNRVGLWKLVVDYMHIRTCKVAVSLTMGGKLCEYRLEIGILQKEL